MPPEAISDPIEPGSIPSGICQLQKGVDATDDQRPKHQAQGHPERDRLTEWPSAGASYLMPKVRMRGTCVHSCLREPYKEVAVANQQPRFSPNRYTKVIPHPATSRPLWGQLYAARARAWTRRSDRPPTSDFGRRDDPMKSEIGICQTRWVPSRPSDAHASHHHD